MSKDRFISIDLQGLDDARRTLQEKPRKIQSALRKNSVLKQIGTQMAASAVTTLREGGRPIKYAPLAESTRARKLKKHKKESSILVAGGTLRQSLDYEVAGGQLFLTSVDYLKYHQFVDDRKPGTFPARPIWGVHDEDEEEIIDIIITELKK